MLPRRLLTATLLATFALAAFAPATLSASGGKDIVERASQLNRLTHQFDTLLAAATCDYFDGARVNLPNVPASNGLIHVVNAVLLP